MQPNRARPATQSGWTALPLLVSVACAALFVWYTSRGLPAFVASHFGISGTADGFMPRTAYLKFTLAIVVLLPLAVVFLPNWTFGKASAYINLPHRDYWLAEPRRAETIEFLRRHSARFGYLLLAFLCYVHWLVVRANAHASPHLAAGWFVGGLLAYLGAVLLWTGFLFRRFRAAPR